MFLLLSGIAAAAEPVPVHHTGTPDTWRAEVDATGIRSFDVARSNGWTAVPFRTDERIGPCWQIEEQGRWTDVGLRPPDSTNCVYEAVRGDMRFGIRYEKLGDRLAVTVSIRNEATATSTPLRVALRLGLDTAISGRPDWRTVHCPTLLRCEPTHIWGSFVSPDGHALGISSPDAAHRWETDADAVQSFGYTPRMVLLSGERLAANEMRVWTVLLEDLPGVDARLSRLAASCRGPIAEVVPAVAEPGGAVELRVHGPNPVTGFLRGTNGPDVPIAFAARAAGGWSAQVRLPHGARSASVIIRDTRGREARATLAARPLWSTFADVEAAAPAMPAELRSLIDTFAGTAREALQEKSSQAKLAGAGRALELAGQLDCLPPDLRGDAQYVRGLWFLYRLTGREPFLSACRDLLASHAAGVREIAVSRAYVVERSNRNYEGYNCAAQWENDILSVIPAETCVTSIHVNLRTPALVRATLAGVTIERRVERSAWLGESPSP